MLNKLAELKVNIQKDYKDKVIKAIEDAGLVVVHEFDTTTDRFYTIAERMDKDV